jgi:glutamate racemase
MHPAPDSSVRNTRSGKPCIGVFDSGVGGLAVLKALHALLPQANLLYVADSGHAPYGERSVAYVAERSRRIATHLIAEGAVGLVIPCNTATAAAVHLLRAEWPQLPIIGIEPGLKPAAAATRNGRIGVMATTGTLASEKFRALVQAQPPHLTVIAQPCRGLADLIEQGDLDAPALRQCIERHVAALRAADVDTVVLGCTHYGFVAHHIAAALGEGVQLIDTVEPVARQAVRRLRAAVAAQPPDEVRVHLQTTGDVARLRTIASAWLPFSCSVEAVPQGTPPA